MHLLTVTVVAVVATIAPSLVQAGSKPPPPAPGCSTALAPYLSFQKLPLCEAICPDFVYGPRSISEVQTIVKKAYEAGVPVRPTGTGHSFHNGLCSDNSSTVLIQTETFASISEFDPVDQSVRINGGVTFFQLADYLHPRGFSIGYTLVNWNLTVVGAIATGSHRSSLRHPSTVGEGALEITIVDGKGDLRVLTPASGDEWRAAKTSLGLMGIIVSVKFRIRPEFKLITHQQYLPEEQVLNGNIQQLIASHDAGNFWWWPHSKKFVYRTYDEIPLDSPGDAFQSTFSITDIEAVAAKALLEPGKGLGFLNCIAEDIFAEIFKKPNFKNKVTDESYDSYPVSGFSYDVLIGGLYKGQKIEWELGLTGYTFEIAVPLRKANALLQRVRSLFELSKQPGQGGEVCDTYRTGIAIKFGLPDDAFLSEASSSFTDEWQDGYIAFDFPTFRPTTGDNKRFNEQWYLNTYATLIEEFNPRVHWGKNNRDIFKNRQLAYEPQNVAKFKAIRSQYDPKGIFINAVATSANLI
ncbi:hypothetical protein HDU97_006264 [Phlyctochytrium planicorne]|nr:hypothetical protein HDU97_006264 [Phlyctochytrium planicorne]